MRAALILASLLGLVTPAAAQPRTCVSSFIVLRGSRGATMSGDSSDLDRVRKAVAPGERAAWTRTTACKEYLVRDTAVIDEIERAWKPANALSEQMGKLGAEEGKLGEQQGKIGEKEGKLGEQQAQLGFRLVNASDAQRVAINREMRGIDAKIKILDGIMRTFDAPMRALDRQIQELSPKQEAAVKQAQAATDAVLARAIASGVAKPFP